MITYGKGLVCAPISSTIAKKLKLPLMEGVNNEMQTPYTHSVDLKGDGVTTGISAEDRFKTIKGLASDDSARESFNVPGHIFPLQAMDGGVLGEQAIQKQLLIYVQFQITKKLQLYAKL